MSEKLLCTLFSGFHKYIGIGKIKQWWGLHCVIATCDVEMLTLCLHEEEGNGIIIYT